MSLLFSIILFIIDEGHTGSRLVVRMRSSLHVRQQTIAHGQCFDGTGMDFSLNADVFVLLAMVNMVYSIHLSHSLFSSNMK